MCVFKFYYILHQLTEGLASSGERILLARQSCTHDHLSDHSHGERALLDGGDGGEISFVVYMRFLWRIYVSVISQLRVNEL